MTGGDRRIGTLLQVSVALLGIAGAAVTTFGEGWNPIALDYAVFWNSIRRPIAQIYQFRMGAVFAYPPTLIPFLKPLALIALWPGYILWSVLSALSFFLAAKRLTDTRTAGLAMFSSASVQNLLLGQTPMFLEAGLLFALSLPSALLAGTIIGFLAAIKPQLFLMAPLVMIIRRDWRALSGMATGGVATALATVGLYGIQPWLDWLNAIPSFGRAIITLDVIRNEVTLTSIGTRLGSNSPLWWLAGTCVAMFATLRLSCRAEGIYLAALILGASTLAAPYALTHDLCGAMPAVAAIVLSGPSALISTAATMVFIGVGLPVMLPLVAFFASFRANFPPSIANQTKGLVSPP
jgi:Glycosyltransferase family 87